MTLETLAIHTEAWLQEELGAQRAVLTVLERLEAAARSGSSAEVERGARELSGLAALAGPREARRRALLARIAGALALAPAEVTLSKLAAHLVGARVETGRLAALRAELRGVVAAALMAGRRVAAVARYHGGLLEDLSRLLLAEAPGSAASGERHLVDARA